MTQQRLLAVLGVVALVAIIGGGLAIALGGGDDAPTVRSASSTTAVVASTPSTLAPSTTLSGPTTTSGQTSVTVAIICTTPEDASQGVVSAWIANDRTAAERCATAAALDTLFETSGAGAQWTFQGCSGDPGVPDCAFTYPGGSAHFTLNGTEAAGWKVVQVGYVAD